MILMHTKGETLWPRKTRIVHQETHEEAHPAKGSYVIPHLIFPATYELDSVIHRILLIRIMPAVTELVRNGAGT